MVVFTGLAVVTVATGGVGAIAGAAIGSSAGTAAATAGTATAIGTAAGVGTAGGAIAGAGAGVIAGAGAGGSIAGAAAGAVAGGTAAVGVGGTGAGAGALAAGALSGPVGWLAVGASETANGSQATYDCWKPVVHDTSEELSSGMALRDLVSHQNIANVIITSGNPTDLPYIFLENVWKEKFEIEYLVIQATGKCVCHAKPVCI